MFLIGPPGPLGRRLATTFASLLNKPYEVLVLHRDVSAEADLRQGREIRWVLSLTTLELPSVLIRDESTGPASLSNTSTQPLSERPRTATS